MIDYIFPHPKEKLIIYTKAFGLLNQMTSRDGIFRGTNICQMAESLPSWLNNQDFLLEIVHLRFTTQFGRGGYTLLLISNEDITVG